METEKKNPIRECYQLGHSIWYDNIERKILKNGEFSLLISKYGVVGVTSNPTIFDKAISKSSDYDEQIKTLAKQGKNVHEIYDSLVIQDIGEAADALLPIYQKSKGIDGYVSIEVLPEYAHDAEKTIEYAKRIFNQLGRKNVLIKVPGTEEGCNAITELVYEGINVNVTLLFSLQQYKSAAKAYLLGLERRVKDGKNLKEINSVASVFVSRIDTRIDKMLEDLANTENDAAKKGILLKLRGKAAVANSKIIYQHFKEISLSKEFKKFENNGASMQRVLWASTGTKNPEYTDVKYVEELIGPNSVNTVPHQTLFAFYDHGIVKSTIEDDVTGAVDVLKQLSALGIDINTVCSDLEKEGIAAFCNSFDSLINSIRSKMS